MCLFSELRNGIVDDPAHALERPRVADWRLMHKAYGNQVPAQLRAATRNPECEHTGNPS
jgi:hypothetical protein